MPIEVHSFSSGVDFLDFGFEDAGFIIVFVNKHDERLFKHMVQHETFIYGCKTEDSFQIGDSIDIYLGGHCNATAWKCFGRRKSLSV